MPSQLGTLEDSVADSKAAVADVQQHPPFGGCSMEGIVVRMTVLAKGRAPYLQKTPSANFLFLIFMLIGFLLLVALAAFIVWDSRRMHGGSAEPISREKMLQGFLPTGLVHWRLCLGFGGMSLLLAYGEWSAPSKPPFTGRWGWLKEVAYQFLGSAGILYLCLVFACIAFVCGFSLWNKVKSGNYKK